MAANAPWGGCNGACVVKRNNELCEADESGGPETKYAALFDPRPVFDGLRVLFLRMTGGPRLVRLEDELGENIETDAGAEGAAAVLEYLERSCTHFDPRSEWFCRPWFASAAWPCFVDSICDGKRVYYLSVNELILVFELQRENIAVFGGRQR